MLVCILSDVKSGASAYFVLGQISRQQCDRSSWKCAWW